MFVNRNGHTLFAGTPVVVAEQVQRQQIHPRYKRELIRAKSPQPAVDTQKYFLRHIARHALPARKAITHSVDPAGMARNQFVPRGSVAILAALDELILLLSVTGKGFITGKGSDLKIQKHDLSRLNDKAPQPDS
jgi:hypothetical protein